MRERERIGHGELQDMHVFHAEVQGDGGAAAGRREGGVSKVRQWRTPYDGGAVGEVSS